ncbi:unnamed protein product, partial [Pylaiella littoralis]
YRHAVVDQCSIAGAVLDIFASSSYFDPPPSSREKQRYISAAKSLSSARILLLRNVAPAAATAAAVPLLGVLTLKVLLMNLDLAMTAAAASTWEGTLHMCCLWHVLKNVVKNCTSSFPDNDDETILMRLFRSAAYAAIRR